MFNFLDLQFAGRQRPPNSGCQRIQQSHRLNASIGMAEIELDGKLSGLGSTEMILGRKYVSTAERCS